ncbi:repressor LexA [Breznakia blatticola]|uniref:Repressor LexA n=1 Tax=Breznakia blatticola TaxID=1754012 RepID=A0A4R7ZFQ3_9FIRM|nr:S24 family peptidase [Breznakia blatticola]TDW16132.1 repressor LexA [Breznakia blatticola]
MNKDILKHQMEIIGISPKEIANHLDVGVSSVYRWLDGTTKSIPQEKQDRLAELLQLSSRALDDDAQNLLKPILGNVKAGYDLFAAEDLLGYEEVTEIESTKGDYYLKVQGDSMIGVGIFDGDLVYVKQCNEVENNKIAVVLVGEEVTIKKVIMKDDVLILEAANQTVANRFFNKNEIDILPVRIIGQVMHSKRNFS